MMLEDVQEFRKLPQSRTGPWSTVADGETIMTACSRKNHEARQNQYPPNVLLWVSGAFPKALHVA